MADSPSWVVDTSSTPGTPAAGLEMHSDLVVVSKPEHREAKGGISWTGRALESLPAAPVTNDLRYPRDLLAYLPSGSGTRKHFTKNKHGRGVTAA